MGKKVFILPENDLESKEIIKLLELCNYKKNVDYFVTAQQWGASWANLEDEIKAEIKELIKPTRRIRTQMGEISYGGEKSSIEIMTIDEYNNIKHYDNQPHYPYVGKYTCGEPEEMMPIKSDIEIYGVELEGENPYNAKNIDHHKYQNEDRRNTKSSIEQVAELLDVELSLKQHFIAANDKGGPRAMLKLAAELGIEDELFKKAFKAINQLEVEAQGITKETIERDLNNLNIEIKDGYTVITTPSSKTRPLVNLMYEKYGLGPETERMLFVSTDTGEINYYGTNTDIDIISSEVETAWAGGDEIMGTGFWGGYCGREIIEQEIQSIITKEREEYNIEDDRLKGLSKIKLPDKSVLAEMGIIKQDTEKNDDAR